MENSGKTLGGGAPSDAQQVEMEAQVEQVAKTAAAQLAGVQAAPGPRKLEEGDHMRYQLLGERVEKADLKIAMYSRELQHAQIERAQRVHALSSHVRHIEEKYSTSLLSHTVTEDGYLIERADVSRV